jgi:2'-aminobiphenyl-2,3-diol 1,2-dioxygenase large subunit
VAAVVSAYATSHVLFSTKGVEDRAARVVAGMKELGRRAGEARPDVLLMIVSDHMFNINLSIQPPFTVGVSDTYLPWGDLGIPVRPFPGHRDFATGLVRHAAASGFDLAMAEDVAPDHGVTVPLLFLKPWGSVPVVPLYVNINMDPAPEPKRCRDLAVAIRGYVEKVRPRSERVAVVGSGGLSHWLSVPKMGTVAEAFDRDVLGTIAAGDGGKLARFTAADIEENAGNGGLEIMNWMMMSVAAGEPKGEAVFYEPIPQWFTGMGGIAMDV